MSGMFAKLKQKTLEEKTPPRPSSASKHTEVCIYRLEDGLSTLSKAVI